jgi:cysteinyl-tRNA synthetase
MAWKLLGEQFDIHAGGIDLVFPHHENEIAQSRCAFHAPRMAQVWMHNGFVQMEGEKMAKSEGNVVTINDLRQTEKYSGRRWRGEVLRLAMLMTNYRQPIDWTVTRLREADSKLARWTSLVGDLETAELVDEPSAGLLAALGDDLNTVAALYALDRLAESATADVSARRELGRNLVALGLIESDERWRGAALEKLKGLQVQIEELRRFGPPQLSIAMIEQVTSLIDPAELNRLIEARLRARQARDWTEADHIRDELAARGVALKDSRDGTTWEVAR